MYNNPEALYTWAQERQLQLRQEAERRRMIRQAHNGSILLWIRLPFLPRHHA